MSVKAGKPIKIAGVRVTPKWDWSEDYLAHVREDARTSPQPNAFDKRRSDAHRTASYVLWLENRDHRHYDLADVPNLHWTPTCEDLSAQPGVFD
jgi:hypothetical protein